MFDIMWLQLFITILKRIIIHLKRSIPLMIQVFGLQQANPISDKFFFHSHMAIMMKLRHQPQPQLPLL